MPLVNRIGTRNGGDEKKDDDENTPKLSYIAVFTQSLMSYAVVLIESIVIIWFSGIYLFLRALIFRKEPEDEKIATHSVSFTNFSDYFIHRHDHSMTKQMIVFSAKSKRKP